MTEDDIFADVIEGNANSGGTNDLIPADLELEQENNPSNFTNDDPDYSVEGIIHDNSVYDEDEEEEGEPSLDKPITQSTLIDELLATKGIKDHTIQMENDEGEIEEYDFYDLPKEEQLAILNSNDSDLNFGLDPHEIDAVNYLRDNKVSLEDAIEYHRRQAVQEYIDSQNIAGIEVSQYTDEQLFALDLKAKYDELTDDEIEIEIQKQLEHPELFAKKVDKLRAEYKQIEIDQLEQAKLAEQSDTEQRLADLQNSLVEVAQGVEDIGGLELDYNDKNDVLSFLLEQDMNGNSAFIKSLEDPNTLFELAWFKTKGKEAFGILHDYYKKQIDSVRKDAFSKGVASVKPGAKQTEQTPGKNFVRKDAPQQGGNKIKHINDLLID